MSASSFLLMQIADAAFPSGGFAHSSGLEAALKLGGTRSIDAFVADFLSTTSRGALPFVRAANEAPGSLAAVDRAYDATLPMTVPNRASRAQGRAFAIAAARTWDAAAPLAAYDGPRHHAPVFGALTGILRIAPSDAQAMFLHGAARNVLSAAVRLGNLGPLEAQRLQSELPLPALLSSNETRSIEDAAQTAPLVEMFAQHHERLDGRLFQS